MEKRDSFFGTLFKPLRRTTAPGLNELAILLAVVMALNALAIDMMLPALGLISDELNLAGENDRQLIIYAFIIGNGVAQLFFGPLVDRFGRRKILMASFAGYIAASILSAIASNFILLLAARVAQGASTAGARVAVSASVRDLVAGRRMAQLISFALTIFMIAPIIAPSLGQGVMIFGHWRWIFVSLLFFGIVVGVWAYLRLPETLSVDRRQPLSAKAIWGAYRTFFTHRITLAYSTASALCFGGLYAYIGTSEQVFLEIFGLGDMFGPVFAIVAAALAAASFLNVRLVGKYGMRPLTHYAVTLLFLANFAHMIAIAIFGDHLIIYMSFMAVSFFSLGLVGPNCNALSMEPMGRIAGYAAAAFGFATTSLSAVLGVIVGRFFHGSTFPIAVSFCIFGALALSLILRAERGKLYQSRDGDHEKPDSKEQDQETDLAPTS